MIMMHTYKRPAAAAALCLAVILGILHADMKEVLAASGGLKNRGPVSVGDLLPADENIVNLSTKNQAVIQLKAIYEPKSYPMIFDCRGGSFPDGKSSLEKTVVFNDGSRLLQDDLSEKDQNACIQLPEQPLRPGWSFQGWFLRGNGVSVPSGVTAQAEFLKQNSRYMIANDEAADLAQAEHDGRGRTVAAAVWRNLTAPEQDAFSPLEPAGDLQDDPWKKGGFHTQLIAYRDGLEDAASYSSRFGSTAYRYGNLILNAETGGAKDYLWFRKPAGAADYEKIEAEGPVLREDRITGALNGCSYKCMVDLGGEYMPQYETEIRVFSLPAVSAIEVYENGELQSPLSFSGKEEMHAS